MMTVRQIERLWGSNNYDRLFHELLTARPEAALRLGVDTTRPVCAAALGVIRLDELSQSHAPICSKLIRSIIAAQQEDGGWGDLVTTALCLRALLANGGNGVAIQGGLEYLVNLQKPEGIWPNIPIRRMPADPYVSALILFELAGQPGVASVVRLDDAVTWFENNQEILDLETRQLWSRAKLKCGSLAKVSTGTRGNSMNGTLHRAEVLIWS